MSSVENVITRENWDVNSQFKELSSLRDQIIDLEDALRKRAKELFNEKKISFSNYESITNDSQKIVDLAAQINSIQFNQVLTDMKEPAKQIIEATNSLNKAAAKIQGIQNFFDILSRLIKLGQVVANAISNGSIAGIGTLVTELKNIADRLLRN